MLKMQQKEDRPFDENFIGDRGNIWDLISTLLHVTDAWPHVRGARSNPDGQKAMLAFYDHFGGKTTSVNFRSKQI